MSGWIKVEDELPPVGGHVFLCVEQNDNNSRWLSEGVYQDGTQKDDGNSIYDCTNIGDVIPKGWYSESSFDGAYVHYREKPSNEKVTHWMERPELPTDGKESAKHGQWVKCKVPYLNALGIPDWKRGYKCTNCGNMRKGAEIKTYSFCPDCGAIMDGGTEK